MCGGYLTYGDINYESNHCHGGYVFFILHIHVIRLMDEYLNN